MQACTTTGRNRIGSASLFEYQSSRNGATFPLALIHVSLRGLRRSRGYADYERPRSVCHEVLGKVSGCKHLEAFFSCVSPLICSPKPGFHAYELIVATTWHKTSIIYSKNASLPECHFLPHIPRLPQWLHWHMAT